MKRWLSLSLILIGGFLLDVGAMFRDIPEKGQVISIIILGALLFLIGLKKLK